VSGSVDLRTDVGGERVGGPRPSPRVRCSPLPDEPCCRPEGAVPAADSAALDLHKGISDPGCKRWPEHLRLLSNQGEMVRGRCKATNQCDYCAKLAAVENSELLAIDAMNGNAPAVWMVLTTPTATLDMSVFYESHRQLMRALARRFPDLEWARLLEFTTGYGPRSRGLRRPHWNCLLKGVPVDAIDLVLELVVKVWCPRVGASPDAQFVGEIGEMGGLMRYIALHFQKESQAPPAGFSGHRFTKSKGYLWTDTESAREEARDALFEKRALWRARKLGLDGDQAEDHVDHEWDLRMRTEWRTYVLAAGVKRLQRLEASLTSSPVSRSGYEDPSVGAS
jgi:hypothetical protein